MLWIILALLSAICIALRSVLSKKVMQHEHALEYGAAQGFLSLLVLIFFLPFIKLDFDWRIYLLLFIISIALTVANLYFLKSVRHSAISLAMPLMNVSPLFLLVLAYFFLGETPGTLAVIGVLLLVVGTYILQMSSGKQHFLDPFKNLLSNKYSMMMIMAVLVYSFTSIMEKGLVTTIRSLGAEGIVAPLSMFVIVHIFVGINFLVIEVSKHGVVEILKDLDRDGQPLFWGALTNLGSNLFFYLALAIPGALVSLIIPIMRLSTLMSALMGGTVFHERGVGMKTIASAVMLAGILFIVL